MAGTAWAQTQQTISIEVSVGTEWSAMAVTRKTVEVR